MINPEDHLRLVHKVLTKIKLKNYEYDDLFQAGCIGLIKASKKFDESKKIKFSTFAMTCIRNQVLQVFQEDKWCLGSQQERLKGIALGPISLETEFEDDATYHDFLRSDENVEEYAINKADADRALSAKNLTQREKTVISWYYYKNYSVSEIAKLLGCSHQTVCNIKGRALEKMRQAVLQN